MAVQVRFEIVQLVGICLFAQDCRAPDGSEVLLSLRATGANEKEVLSALKRLADMLQASNGFPATTGQDGPTVFISYRRADSEGIAGRICDHLQSRFGRDCVFMDVESILPGVDFREVISLAVRRCNILLAIIGENWLTAARDGMRRLDDPEDYVRLEIETGLARGIPVVPLLVRSTTPMPTCDELPPSLADLAHRNAVWIDPGANFSSRIATLADQLEILLADQSDQGAERSACHDC